MLSAAQRITSAADYRRVVRRGRRVAGAVSTAHIAIADDAAEPRFGFIVSKAVGNAVVRNRVRRRFKAACAAVGDDLAQGGEVVFRAKPEASSSSFATISADVARAVERIGRR